MNPSLKTLCPVLLLAALALSACGGGGGSGVTASNQTSGPDDTMGTDPEISPPDEPGPGSPGSPRPLATPSLPGTADFLEDEMETFATAGFDGDRNAFGDEPITFTYPRELNVAGWSESGGLHRTEDDQFIAFIRTDIEMPDTRRLLDVYPYDIRYDNDDGPSDVIGVDLETFMDAYGTVAAPDGRSVYASGATRRGTFGDATGTYRCRSSNCTIDVDGNGEINVFDGWVFTPLTEAAESATIKIGDEDYLHYGVWAEIAGGEFSRVESFAGSSLAESSDAAIRRVDLQGQALTYTGGAAGMYVRGDRHGTFTGQARLTVNFSRNTPAIGGEITDLSGGASGWTVTLNPDELHTKIPKPELGPISDLEGTTEGGTWSGQIYGTRADVVVGEFNAVFDDGRLLGGFGTRKQ